MVITMKININLSLESIYLLFHCEVAIELWASIFHLFGIEWVMFRRVIELLACWKGQLGSCNILEAWRWYIFA
jgi:hypothetical protein